MPRASRQGRPDGRRAAGDSGSSARRTRRPCSTPMRCSVVSATGRCPTAHAPGTGRAAPAPRPGPRRGRRPVSPASRRSGDRLADGADGRVRVRYIVALGFKVQNAPTSSADAPANSTGPPKASSTGAARGTAHRRARCRYTRRRRRHRRRRAGQIYGNGADHPAACAWAPPIGR